MDKIKMMEKKAKEIRYHIIDAIGTLGVGHIGGCLSVADVLSVLYFGDHMRVDPKNPKMEGRDRLVISKGHAGPALYAALALKGFFPMDWLQTLNQPGTNLPSHCDMNRTPGIDMTAGSLGQGISCAVGIALGSRLKKDNATIYCIIGDGESQEGQVWEASMAAGHFKLDNLIVFMDNNKLQIDGYVKDIMDVKDPVDKWSSFGFYVQFVDGHDVAAIDGAIKKAKTENGGKPSMIILDTVKGKGVPFVIDAAPTNHNMIVTPEQKEQTLKELA